MTEDQRRIASTVLTTMAETLPYWRDSAIALLACFAIGCLAFVALLYES